MRNLATLPRVISSNSPTTSLLDRGRCCRAIGQIPQLFCYLCKQVAHCGFCSVQLNDTCELHVCPPAI